MTVNIGRYSFEGPYRSTSSLEDRSGVYAILCNRREDYSLLDVGETHEVGSRVDRHDRADCWRRYCEKGTIVYAVYYTPNLHQTGRKKIEQEIREQYLVDCGER